jgi:hypothetical protein
MDAIEMENTSCSTAPRTATVLVFLAAFAIMVSWLGTYAAPNALASAGLITDFSREADPRPAWMLRTFIGVFGVFGTIALLFRVASHRQLRRIDAMADAED